MATRKGRRGRATDHLYKRGRIWWGWTWIVEGSERRQERKSTACTDLEAARIVVAGWERDSVDPASAARRDAKLGDALDVIVKQKQSLAKAAEKRNVDSKMADGSDATVEFYEFKARSLAMYAGKVAEDIEPNTKLSKDRKNELVALGRRVALVDVGTRSFVDDMVQYRREEDVSESTIAKERMVLRSALLEAKARGLWSGDLEIVVPRGFASGYEPRKTSLTIDQVWLVIDKLEPHRSARVAYAVATSAEKRAVGRALAGDIPKGVEYVQVRGTKRKGRDRIVGVVLPWQRELLDYARQNADGGEDGTLFSEWQNDIRDLALACAKAGVPRVTSNDLRRSYAVNMRLEGLPLASIAPDMGHADTRMLERVYGRLSPEQLAEEKRQIIAARKAALTVIPGGKAKRAV